jgi:hypothetical protein
MKSIMTNLLFCQRDACFRTLHLSRAHVHGDRLKTSKLFSESWENAGFAASV